MPVVAPRVEILHVAQTIAAERQRVEKLSDTVFTRVEGVAAEMSPRRIAIRYDHLRKRGTVDDRPQLFFVLIADAMENEPFAHMEAHAKLPFLPADEMTNRKS